MASNNAIVLTPVLKALKLSGVHPVYMAAFEYADRNKTWAKYGITNKLRAAWFLAQILHESGGLVSLRENMNYSAKRILEVFGVNKHSASITATEAVKLANNPQGLAERVYGLGNPRKAKELGNTRPGDGWRFRGGGPGQLTGGANFKEAARKLNIDLYNKPELIETVEHTLAPTLNFWQERNLNEVADRNNGIELTKRINGGTNGYTDRVTWFNKVWRVIQTGIVSAPTSAAVREEVVQSTANPGQPASAWEVAERDEGILKLQKDLNELGADPKLEEDGKMGPKTEKAVRAYQSANNLEVDGVPGDVTLASIKTRLATLGTTPPTAVSTKPAGNVNEVTGGTLVGTGITIDQAVEKIGPIKELVGDNQYLQIALGVLILIGVGIIVYSQVRKYLWRNQTILE